MILRPLQHAALAVAFIGLAAGPAASHEGDLKLLHKQPGRAGAGFQNAQLARPDTFAAPTDPDTIGNRELAMTGFLTDRVTLLSWLTLTDLGVPLGGNGNSLWGYTSPGGRQYALMGTSVGITFVDVTVPNSPVIVHQGAGPASFWRDVRTFQDHAYAVSEGTGAIGGGGIQVFDLSQIDSGVVTDVGSVDAVGTSDTHTVFVNEDSGFLYRAGGDTIGQTGLRIYDLNTDPANPTFVASWNDRYVHEVSVESYTSGPFAGKEIAFVCGGFNLGFVQTGLHVLDVTDKLNITVMDIEFYPGAAFCHQGWLSDDQQHFYINDEYFNGDQRTFVMDVSDLTAVTFAGSFDTGSTSAAHNVYVADDKLYSANYTSGLYVWDLSVSPTAPTTFAAFDTEPAHDDRTFNSLWNIYPYFTGDVVLGSDIEQGLFVWYVGDPKLTFTLSEPAPALIAPDSTQIFQVAVGELSPGDYQAGTATFHYDVGSGFVSVPLNALGGLDFQVTLPAQPCGVTARYYFSGESTDGTVWVDPLGGPLQAHESSFATELFALVDDFETDQGWSASSGAGATSGFWERGTPVNDPGWPYDPIQDCDGSGQCWLTGNANGDTDVDGGRVILTSPTLDLVGVRSSITYSYYLIKDLPANDPLDRILVEVDENDGAGPWAEVARHDVNTGFSWNENTIDELDLAAAGVTLTTAMRVRFCVEDGGVDNPVEAGLDAFEVDVVRCGITAPSFCDASDGALASCPCGNAGDPGTGCDVQQSTGGVRLEVVTQRTTPQNRATLAGFGFPAMSTPTAIVIRAPGLDGASPVVFGDGLRCVGTPLVRLAATFAATGISNHTLGHGAMAGSGDFYYQLWFRNTPAMFCTPSAFNLSSGRVLAW